MDCVAVDGFYSKEEDARAGMIQRRGFIHGYQPGELIWID